MPVAYLDDAFAKRVDRPQKGYVEYTDEKIGGYIVRVYAERIVGTLRYSPLGSKKKKRYPLGEHPRVTMAVMRKRAEEARGKFRQGADPAADREAIRVKRQEEETTPPLTFDALADLYAAALPNMKDSWEQDKGYIDRDARPVWGKKLAAAITEADCAKRLLDVKARAPVVANRVRSALRKLFEWAVDQRLLTVNPMLGIKKPTKERGREDEVDRVLADGEFVVIWKAIEAAKLADGLRAAFKALALTGKRPQEIAGLALSELQHLDDPSQAVADFPASRMKGRRRHILPLTEPVIALIKGEIKRQRDEAEFEHRPVSEFVFTSRFMDRDRIARHSLSQAMKRIVADLDPNGPDGEIVKRLQANPPKPKTFRATCATGMARLKVPYEDRQAVLAHADQSVMKRHYDAYDRLDEKRAALRTWAHHVEDLVSGRKGTGVVVPFRAMAARE